MNAVLEHLRFRLALWIWARWLPVLAYYRRDLKSLINSVVPASDTRYRGLEAAYISKRVRRVVRKPWLMRDRPCLRSGLLAYRFLALAGHKPELHFGVDQASVSASRLSAHCWVVLDGRVILNEPARGMIEVFVLRTGCNDHSEFHAIAT
jgi:hypothetical protein